MIITLQNIREPIVKMVQGFIMQFYAGEGSGFPEEGVDTEAEAWFRNVTVLWQGGLVRYGQAVGSFRRWSNIQRGGVPPESLPPMLPLLLRPYRSISGRRSAAEVGGLLS